MPNRAQGTLDTRGNQNSLEYLMYGYCCYPYTTTIMFDIGLTDSHGAISRARASEAAALLKQNGFGHPV